MSRFGGWIQTYTGKQFWPLDPRPEDVDIEDIAHSLAHTFRWNGHTSEGFSVAQHSIYVARLVPESAQFWALLHDASEAYMQDVPRPLKPHFGPYREYEDQLTRVIRSVFDVNYNAFVEERVKDMDTAMLFAERDALFSCSPPYPYDIEHLNIGLQMVDVDPCFYCWKPEQAKQAFLNTFHRLSKRNW